MLHDSICQGKPPNSPCIPTHLTFPPMRTKGDLELWYVEENIPMGPRKARSTDFIIWQLSPVDVLPRIAIPSPGVVGIDDQVRKDREC